VPAYMIIFSRSASNVSLSARSGRASIKAFIILQTRRECDWPNDTDLSVQAHASVQCQRIEIE
jgi:hypothetical protein